jgi:hypothetical protein
MKKILITLLIIGFSLGISQLFYIRQITNVDADTQRTMARCNAIMPECLNTLDAINVRGFPLTSSSTYYSSDTHITPKLLANIVILAFTLPTLGYATYVVKNRIMQ